MNDGRPTLWQIDISHYGEKIRWTLEHKRIAHVRRTPLTGFHIPVALWLSRGASNTLPILELDGRKIADSTAIIAALEQRYPEHPLYPSDPAELQRALDLEDYFDEQLGPAVRQFVFHELVGEPERLTEFAVATAPPPLNKSAAMTGAYARAFADLRWRASDDGAAAAGRAKVIASMDRLDAELGASGGEFLVGDSLSVADVTAAALFYPLVRPENGPLPPGLLPPATVQELRDSLSDRPGYRWVEERFRARVA